MAMQVNLQEQATLALLLSREAIGVRVKELAIQISRDYAGKNLLLVGVLKGAFVFLAYLMCACKRCRCKSSLSGWPAMGQARLRPVRCACDRELRRPLLAGMC